MPVAADYPFLDFFWSMLLIFLWIAWIFILFRIIIDVFRRDESGLKKTIWVDLSHLRPVPRRARVPDRERRRHDAARHGAIPGVAGRYGRLHTPNGGSGGGGGSAAEIAKAKELLDSGAISQAEFDQIKQKALA